MEGELNDTVQVRNEAIEESEETEKNNENDEIEKTERLCRLPFARIRTIVKADQDVTIASQESVFLIAKATELFIEQLTKETYQITQRSKRKTIQKRDLDIVLETNDELTFLEGTLD